MAKRKKTIALECIRELTMKLLDKKICLYEISQFFSTIEYYHEAKCSLEDSVKGSIGERFYKNHYLHMRKYLEEDLEHYKLGVTIEDIDKMDLVWEQNIR